MYDGSMPTVIKATGNKEPFNEQKVITSIKRAGIPEEIRDQVLSHVKSKLYENIPTSEIYHHIIEFLKNSPHPFSPAKYGLKQSIMDFGPTGYPFEDFVAEILKTEGYETQVRQILNGKCITHEIDVLAKKEGPSIMVECKFHNRPGTRSNTHVSLYTKARFDDVKEKYNLKEACLITNTKITIDGLDYAVCNNMKVISWNYPEGESLRDLIEKSKLHPITVLRSLSEHQKKQLLSQNVVLAKTLCKNPNLINTLGLSSDERKNLENELSFVCDFC